MIKITLFHNFQCRCHTFCRYGFDHINAIGKTFCGKGVALNLTGSHQSSVKVVDRGGADGCVASKLQAFAGKMTSHFFSVDCHVGNTAVRIERKAADVNAARRVWSTVFNADTLLAGSKRNGKLHIDIGLVIVWKLKLSVVSKCRQLFAVVVHTVDAHCRVETRRLAHAAHSEGKRIAARRRHIKLIVGISA